MRQGNRLGRIIAINLFAVILAAGSSATAQADCGGYDSPIVFGGLDWDSGLFHNALARHILEEGYGCLTSSVPGSTLPLMQGAIRGDVDVIMEVWLDQVPDFWAPAVEEGTVVELGVNFPDGTQGWYVPRYVIEGDSERGIEPMAPDLESVFDLPRYAELFRDPEQPDKGRFYNGVIGWQLEVINNLKLEVYELSDDFTNFRPGTAVAMFSALEGAYLRGEPWVGYQWEPTWILGKLDMVQLEEPEYTEECWEHVLENLDTPEQAEQACAYPTSMVLVGAGGSFVEEAPTEIIEFLSNYETSANLVSAQLAYMEENGATPEEAALHFLEAEQDVWTEWVPADVAERLMESLR